MLEAIINQICVAFVSSFSRRSGYLVFVIAARQQIPSWQDGTVLGPRWSRLWEGGSRCSGQVPSSLVSLLTISLFELRVPEEDAFQATVTLVRML
jgi:hypothetical protein